MNHAAARYDEGCYEKYAFTYFLVREALSTDRWRQGVGVWQRAPYFRK